MSTRGAIARRMGDGWMGRYQHSDSYPTWLGRELYAITRNRFKGDVEALLKFAVDDHPKGWSSFPESCYCHTYDNGSEVTVITGCECRVTPFVFDHAQPRWATRPTEPSCDPLFMEWVYVLDAEAKTMAILANESETVSESATRYVHRLITVVHLDEDEPDWQAIQSSAAGWQ